jgi:hypothetical protein
MLVTPSKDGRFMLSGNESKRNYSQTVLIEKLGVFSHHLEKNLEKQISAEVKETLSVLPVRNFSFTLNRKLTPLEKLKFLKYINRYHIGGYCLGLSYLLMSSLFVNGHPYKFFEMIKFIIYSPVEELLIYEDIAEFYISLAWAQFSEMRTQNRAGGSLLPSHSKEILSELSSLPIVYFAAEQHKKFPRKEFLKLLDMLDENKYLRLTVVPTLFNLTKSFLRRPSCNRRIQLHALVIYTDPERNFYLYNSNYIDGEAKIFTYAEYHKIYDELAKCYYNNSKAPTPFVLYLNYDVLYIDYDEMAAPVNRTTCGLACW